MKNPRPQRIGLSPLFLLATGTILNLYGQHLSDLKFAQPEAHILPSVKFLASFIFAALGKLRGPPTPVKPTPRQSRLMSLIGILDAAAYVLFCIGFTYCGTSISSLVLAATAQLFTALATRFILKKHLTGGQLTALCCIALGLVIRALPPSLFGIHPSTSQNKTSTTSTDQNDLIYGVSFVVFAAFLYSGLGVAYEALTSGQGGQGPPPYPDVLWHISSVGAVGALSYQAVYVLPQWESLLRAPMQAARIDARLLVIKLVIFGVLFNLHMFAQSLMFKAQGALGVSLVNNVRGAVLAVVAGLLFCSPSKPYLCLTVQSGLAAAVTTAGGFAWVLAGAKVKKDKETDAKKKD